MEIPTGWRYNILYPLGQNAPLQDLARRSAALMIFFRAPKPAADRAKIAPDSK